MTREENAESASRNLPVRAWRWVSGLKNLRFSLPILTKDLTELAARRRTYIVRTIYALLLFAAFALCFMVEVSRRGLTFSLLGAGKALLERVIVIQVVGVYLFLPPMVAPSIAGEKERGTLALLFTTDLRPWEIIIQKYISRLAPMFMFLLLSLPLMAVAYSLGGFSSQRLLLAAYVILMTCMQIAAFALMWSAYSRNTSEATAATYAGAIVLATSIGGLTLLLAEYVTRDDFILLIPITSIFPSVLLMRIPFRTGFFVMGCVLPWVWTALFLILAKRFLVTRAFIKKKKPKDFFKQMQGAFHVLKWWWKGDYSRRPSKRRRAAGDLPGEYPIVWRDLSDSTLRAPGGFAFTAGVFGFVLVGSALLFTYWIGFHRDESGLVASVMIFSVWLVGALAITVKSASAFAQERAQKTLELLTTTPLTGREIVAQKAAAIRRRALLLFVLLGALFIFEVIIETQWSGERFRRGSYGYLSAHEYDGADFGQLGYLFVSFMSVIIYLWMAGWLAGWIGLRTRKQSQATTLAFGVIFGICVGPFVVAPIIAELSGVWINDGLQWLYALSPGTIVVLTEIANLDNGFRKVFGTHAAAPILLNWIVCIGIGATFRGLSLANADRYLGRPAVTREAG